jgi:hypothetical protein
VKVKTLATREEVLLSPAEAVAKLSGIVKGVEGA